MSSQADFVALYESQRVPLRGFLLAATGCPHQADDLLQNVACVLLAKFARYDHGRPFGPWVIGIARLEVLKWRQRRARRREVLSVEAIDVMAADFAGRPDLLAERLALLPDCIAQLQEAARRLVALRYDEGLAAKAIAARVGRTPAAIDMALSRIRRTLRDCMASKLAETRS
jgi:RNA polymerase sigma-70 factor (ECF subfamily)